MSNAEFSLGRVKSSFLDTPRDKSRGFLAVGTDRAKATVSSSL
jgi:hypothetical protein